ncbi:MAG: exosortase/archaeosortase family protein [Planctomycetota bacterium]
MTSSAAAPSNPRPTLGLLVGVVCLIGLFVPLFSQLVRIWILDSSYTHGFFIVPISIWLTWLIVAAHPLPGQGETALGSITLIIGLILHLLGVVLRFLPIEMIALFLTLRGMAVMLGGRRWANRLLFPTFFLIFLFPLPVALMTRITVGLQDIITAISGEVVSWFVLSFRRGNTIHIAGVNETLYVGQECSGVRQLMAFLAMAALVSYLGRVGWLRGTLLMVLAVPVAIATNVVRVLLMALGLVSFGPTWISTKMHDVPAMFTLPLGILMFFGLLWFLAPPEAPAEPAATGGDEPKASPAPRIWRVTLLLGVALALQLGLLAHMILGPTNTYAPLRDSFANMPKTLLWERVGKRPLTWEMETIVPEKEIRAKLPYQPVDLFYRRFYSPEMNVSANVYVVHSENGEDRKHHPEVCIRDVLQLPEDVASRAAVPLGDDPQRTVQRFGFNVGPSQNMAVYYWHYTFRPLQHEQQSWLQQLYATFDRSPPSVTVLVTSNASREQWPLLEQRLLAPLDFELRGKHLPPDVRMSSERLPILVER